MYIFCYDFLFQEFSFSFLSCWFEVCFLFFSSKLIHVCSWSYIIVGQVCILWLKMLLVFVWQSLLVWSLVCCHLKYSFFAHDYLLGGKFVFYGWALLFIFVWRILFILILFFCHLSYFFFVHDSILWYKFVFVLYCLVLNDKVIIKYIIFFFYSVWFTYYFFYCGLSSNLLYSKEIRPNSILGMGEVKLSWRSVK